VGGEVSSGGVLSQNPLKCIVKVTEDANFGERFTKPGASLKR
jgi:hypothetical protein